jgi:hypothetical protein
VSFFFEGEVENGHGRLERRKVWVLPADAEQTGFPFAHSVVRTLTEALDPADDRQLPQLREWISSLDAVEASSRRIGQLVRGHWNIENGTHRSRDVQWREDHQRMRHHGRAHVLASLRQLALWLHTAVSRGALGRSCRPGIRPGPVSHQLKRVSHAPKAAFPLILRDPRE